MGVYMDRNECKPDSESSAASNMLTNRYLRRYVKYLLIGAFFSCAAFNVVLRAGSGLEYFCEQECLELLLKRPLSSLDRDVIAHIKDNLVDGPFPVGSFKKAYELDKPPWSKLSKWGESQEFINNFFAAYKTPGTFVEIGAQDGEFMSLTLWLEQEKGFTGLLIEPNEIDYPKLRSKKRSAYSIKACASPGIAHAKDILWIRHLPDHLPVLLRRIQEGSNRLLKYVAKEDRELGEEQPVQCFNAGAMIVAALDTPQIDFLSISTHGGEMDIFESISHKISIRMLALVSPLASNEEYDQMKALAKERDMVEVAAKGNVHLFMNHKEVMFSKE